MKLICSSPAYNFSRWGGGRGCPGAAGAHSFISKARK